MSRAGTMLDDAVARLRGHDRPLPWVTVEHGPAVPGWALRAAFVVAVPLLVLATASRTTALAGLVTTLVLALTGWAALRPGHGPAYATVVACALLLLGAPGPFDATAPALAAGGYVVVRLGWWAGHVRWRTRVEVAALAHAARRDLTVLGATLVVALLAWAVAGRPVGALVVAGTLALAAVAWLALRRDDGGSGEPP
ncbi:hypothetical protein [Isoptericola variabilis]|uniref:Putative membrane protein, glycine-rich n=1 Tax=Isoptericola variabilis (strain 225) TaxID=743718 RepID=F6FUG3_ISOV2|nr:hypothetical protein [Isoptericola variabilis]AEG44291.1 putative membrane protein, glycine-rich [Isoptericola variabilis 225]TWH28869.1 hypothetical protein L600_003600000120 [Isoptericola variabilis J7]